MVRTSTSKNEATTMKPLPNALTAAINIFILSTLAGCAGIAQQLPSVQSCQHIDYTRDGLKVTIHAECTL